MAELNPVTNRVDYYGPMVNKAARIQAQAGDDTIAVSDAFIAQLGSEQTQTVVLASRLRDSTRTQILQRELREREFEIGFKSSVLKGIEAPENISLVHHVPTKTWLNTNTSS
jgi:adenylate cyclase